MTAVARKSLDPLKFALAAFASTRLVLLTVGLLTTFLIQPLVSSGNPFYQPGHVALTLWSRWDSAWYLDVATHGYAAAPRVDGQANWAFFPGFPFLAAALARLLHIPVYLAMLLISNIAFIVALLLLYNLAAEEYDDRTAKVAVFLISAAPGSYIFSAAYTESLFVAALTAALLAMRRRRWIVAGGCAALATLTRNLGIGLVLPFLLMAEPWTFVRRRRSGPEQSGKYMAPGELFRISTGLALPVLAAAAFSLILYLRSGNPLAFITIQHAWHRRFGDPLSGLVSGLIDPRAVSNGDYVSLLAAWISLGMLVVLAFQRKWPFFALAGFMTLVPLTSGLLSYARFSLTIVPILLAASSLLARRVAAAAATLAVLATLNGFMMVAWTLGLGMTK